jgi:glucose-6-phosphate 1-dehydrogenase
LTIENHMVVLFGSTGDLTKRKIIPALYQLIRKKQFSKECPIVCLGRREQSTAEFIDHLELAQYIHHSEPELIGQLSRQLVYLQQDLKNIDADNLYHRFDEIAKEFGCGTNKLFYLALPASVFSQAAEIIKLFIDDPGWQRVVFEKPFGDDLPSAEVLNNAITAVLREDQIYRVDHYLGKELVQNIFTLRFHNEIFNWAWHCEAIDHVQITASEVLGVEERAGYYDKSGAVRDMVQNHLLQLLSLVAMEPPLANNAEEIRNRTGEVIASLIPVQEDDIVLGQYQGYREEKGVDSDSQTETFAAFKVYIDMPRWQGVPFYLKTGKKLDERYADIKVVFKHNRELCKNGDCDQPNIIVIRIQPDDGIAVAFNVKRPGRSMLTEPVLMDFCHHCYFGPNTPEAYESILLNVMQGESTAFARWDWIRDSWKFVDQLRAAAQVPLEYPPGGTGPSPSDVLLERSGRRWIHGEISPRRSQQQAQILPVML